MCMWNLKFLLLIFLSLDCFSLFTNSYKQSHFWCFGVSVISMICIAPSIKIKTLYISSFSTLRLVLQKNKNIKVGISQKTWLCINKHFHQLQLSLYWRKHFFLFLLCIVSILIVCTGTCATACVQLALHVGVSYCEQINIFEEKKCSLQGLRKVKIHSLHTSNGHENKVSLYFFSWGYLDYKTDFHVLQK